MSANEAAIRDGVAAGLSFGQIARSLGKDRTTIQRQAKRLGLQSIHGCESSLTAADEDTIRRRVAAGHAGVLSRMGSSAIAQRSSVRCNGSV